MFTAPSSQPLRALLLQFHYDRGELLLPVGLLLELGLDAIYLLSEVEDTRADFLEDFKVALQALNLFVKLVYFVELVGVLDKAVQLV